MLQWHRHRRSHTRARRHSTTHKVYWFLCTCVRVAQCPPYVYMDRLAPRQGVHSCRGQQQYMTHQLYIMTHQLYIMTHQLYIMTHQLYIMTHQLYIMTHQLYIITPVVYHAKKIHTAAQVQDCLYGQHTQSHIHCIYTQQQKYKTTAINNNTHTHTPPPHHTHLRG